MTRRILTAWIPLALGSILAYGTIYAAVQQDYRQSANDPQIQLAEDGAADLSNGTPAQELIDTLPTVDMSQSLSPFMMIFDQNGALISSSGYMGDSNPFLPPSGVFTYVKANGEDRITWQIPTGQRFATVVTSWSDATSSGYILAARSLREVESRESQLELIVGAAGLLTVLLSLAGIAYWMRS